jgi:hypothetical protein
VNPSPPPEKEKAGTLETSGSLETLNSYDTANVADTAKAGNSKSLPPLPPGYGYNEDNRPEPIVEHPSRQPEPEHFTPEQEQAAKFLVELCLYSFGNVRTAKAAALWVWLGRDTRKISAIAKECAISANGIRAEIRALKKFVREVQS